MRRRRLALPVVLVALALTACGSGDDESADTTIPAEVPIATIAPPTTQAAPTTVDTTPGAVLTGPIEYTIADGDSPSKIAGMFGIPLQALLDANGWELVDNQVPGFPFAGEIITIPAGATMPVASTTTVAGSTDGATQGSTEVAATTTEPENGVCGTYVIMENDNPSVVARKLDTTVDKLNAANASTDGYSSFFVGLSINVPC
ncbi:MAG: LysM peptidoglycan-binding domain-containing protein [Acidimicrobiales bacterium]